MMIEVPSPRVVDAMYLGVDGKTMLRILETGGRPRLALELKFESMSEMEAFAVRAVAVVRELREKKVETK